MIFKDIHIQLALIHHLYWFVQDNRVQRLTRIFIGTE
jgi:hypothetical protein